MRDAFYILPNEDFTWFQLRLRSTHFCISCSDTLSGILTSLRVVVRKYRTEEKLLRTLNDHEGGGRISKNELERVLDLFNEQGDIYSEEIASAVNEELTIIQSENRRRMPYSKVKSKLKAPSPHVTGVDLSSQTDMTAITYNSSDTGHSVDQTVIRPKVIKPPKIHKK